MQSVVNRSIRAFKYFTPKDTANAVFVFSRLAAPGSVGAEWLQGYVDVSHWSRLGSLSLVLCRMPTASRLTRLRWDDGSA